MAVDSSVYVARWSSPFTNSDEHPALMQTLEEALGKEKIPALIAAMCNRRLTSLDQVTEHLEFECSESSNLQVFVDIFSYRIKGYLHGVGHPITSRAILSSETVAGAADDKLLRARALLLAATDSDLLPITQHWSLTVSAPCP